MPRVQILLPRRPSPKESRLSVQTADTRAEAGEAMDVLNVSLCTKINILKK